MRGWRRVAKDCPVHIWTQGLAADSPCGLPLNANDDGFAKPLALGHGLAEVANSCAYPPCKIGLRRHVKGIESLSEYFHALDVTHG